MLTITDVKRKGNLMILTVETDLTVIGEVDGLEHKRVFNLEIDANADDTIVWDHILRTYENLKAVIEKPSPDVDLEKKWKGKKREK